MVFFYLLQRADRMSMDAAIHARLFEMAYSRAAKQGQSILEAFNAAGKAADSPVAVTEAKLAHDFALASVFREPLGPGKIDDFIKRAAQLQLVKYFGRIILPFWQTGVQ